MRVAPQISRLVRVLLTVRRKVACLISMYWLHISPPALYDACAALGVSLPKLTFPGQDPNRPLSSVSGSPSSTQSPSQSQSTQSESTSRASQSVVTTLTSPFPTISQSTVTSLPASTVLPNVTAATSTTTRSSASRSAGSMDLRVVLVTMGSLVTGFLLIWSCSFAAHFAIDLCTWDWILSISWTWGSRVFVSCSAHWSPTWILCEH